MSEIATVNVIEYFSDTIQQLRSFADTEEGNKAAERLFYQLAKENGFRDLAIAVGVEEGFLEDEGYKLFLVHSVQSGGTECRSDTPTGHNE